MPLIKPTTTPTPATTTTTATLGKAATATDAVSPTNENNNFSNQKKTKHGKQIAKSMPVTPVQPKSPSDAQFPIPSSFSSGAGLTPNDDTDNLYDIYDHLPHSYPNYILADSDGDNIEFELDEDSSSLAMITPPPPYDTPQLQVCKKKAATANTSMSTSAIVPPQPPPRKFLFGNREIFNMSPGTPSTSLASAITPTKLSAAAAAMFAAPQMVQLNRKWTNLHRKRRRRNSSSGDSKELDKLVLQSVDWDENEMY